MTIESIQKHRHGTVEETGIATRTTTSAELATSTRTTEAQAEIQGAIVVAQRFPRNEDVAFEKLMRSSKRAGFAEIAQYSFPRGGSRVSGPSVNIAREAARVWGNIRHGLEILRDDEDERHIRGWAWDLETNTKVIAEDSFQKLIQRKPKGGGPAQWVVPDERDLRELTNRRGAILVRNCLLQLLPPDLIADAMARCNQTLRDRAQQDPDAERKKVIEAFSSLNITPKMLQEYLGHPVGQSSPDEIATLREVYLSIRDGNTTWAEYIEKEEETVTVEPSISIDDIKPEEPKPDPSKAKKLSAAKRKEFEKRIKSNDAMLPSDVHTEIEEMLGAKLEDLTEDKEADLEALLADLGVK